MTTAVGLSSKFPVLLYSTRKHVLLRTMRSEKKKKRGRGGFDDCQLEREEDEEGSREERKQCS